VNGVKVGYDRWAQRYDDRDPSTVLDEPLLLSLAEPLAGRRVLDLACGTGRYSRLLAARGAEVIGADLSRGMLLRARSRTRVIQAAAERLPFAPHSFDLVTCGLLFDHVEDPRQPFREISRVLRPDGRALVTSIHPEMQRLTGADVCVEGIRIPGRIHEIEFLESAARAAGLFPLARHELRVTGEMRRHRNWRWRAQVPALTLFAFRAAQSP
jgi:ubiquinone/menaquinone biosynthesis C-methylase UbiE